MARALTNNGYQSNDMTFRREQKIIMITVIGFISGNRNLECNETCIAWTRLVDRAQTQ